MVALPERQMHTPRLVTCCRSQPKTVLVAALGRSGAWAGGAPAVLDGWERIVDLNRALSQERLSTRSLQC